MIQNLGSVAVSEGGQMTPLIPCKLTESDVCSLSHCPSVFFCRWCHAEDFHHPADCGYRRGQQEQLCGALCHHHQCEESASTLGEGQLQRGHTGKHCSGHAHRGRTCVYIYIHIYIKILKSFNIPHMALRL